jgi:choline monooxygenase
MTGLDVDDDVRRAHVLGAWAYGADGHGAALERLFPRTWHLMDVEEEVSPAPESARPVTLLPGCLDEPLVLTSDRDGEIRLVSNVCTHRASLVVDAPCKAATLRCRYHGRRFGLDGRLAAAPGFEGAVGFPTADDDLQQVPIGVWGPLRFASLRPEHPLEDLVAPLRERLAFLPVDGLRATEVRHYDVAASWLLYVDNYLEGFHIPFVHPGLLEALDFGGYATELTPLGSVQIGVAKADEPCFALPEGHRDHGRRIAAYYAWLFPCTMINAYPWGLSVNAVRPQGPDRVRVTFASYVVDSSLRGAGAGADLHAVELEDEAVVESVQKGMRSRLLRRGRYAPAREAGVHHFHRLMQRFLGG